MRTELAIAFTASVLINAGAVFSIDRAAIHYDQWIAAEKIKVQKKNAGPVSFEYVESLPQKPAKRPLKTKKISDRDVLNQDLTRDKDAAQGPPHVKTIGPADQLAQKRLSPSSPSMKASPAVLPQPPQAEKPPMETSKKEAVPIPDSGFDQKEKVAELKRNDGVNIITERPKPPMAPSKPSPAMNGLTGAADRITTSEISKAKSHGAQIYGVTSFEAMSSDMGVYVKNMKEKIWLAWFPYLVIHYPKDFKTADAMVSFKLNAKGEVKIVELLDSSGSPLFASFCMEAIQRAGSFGPVPKEILDLTGKDELEVKFAFHYW